jgi:hypothetical protein
LISLDAIPSFDELELAHDAFVQLAQVDPRRAQRLRPQAGEREQVVHQHSHAQRFAAND